MKISVAMCTYNGAEFLPQQLQSIVEQLRPPDEIVICDDGSTDKTQALLKQFAAESPIPVSLRFNDQNLGSSRNFEQAIRLCAGDVIALSDQDDVWRSDKLQYVEESFNGTPRAGLFFSDAEIVDVDLNPLGKTMWEVIDFNAQKRKLVAISRGHEVLITGWTVTGATMAFRSGFVNLALPIPDGIAMIHDGWIALTIASVADVVMIDEPLIKYRQHGRQQIGAPDGTKSQPSLTETWGAALRRHSSSADLYKILSALDRRLREQSAAFDVREALLFVGDYSFHLNVRANLPPNRLSRLPSILRELVTLRYHEYANGFKSAAKDFVS